MCRHSCRRNSTTSTSALWCYLSAFVLVLTTCTSPTSTTFVAASAAVVSTDWFDWLDVNHDGLIDRSEYRDGVHKLEHVVQNPLPLTAAAVATTTKAWFSWGWMTMKGFWKAFTKAVGMIVATEIGDKTFFIASVLSMRHDRSAVFCGALFALVVMTILSAALGRLLPTLLPPKYTHWIAGLLFLYFGVRLIWESRTMSAHQVSSELEHVEEELLGSSQKQKKLEDKSPSNSTIMDDIEACPPSRGGMATAFSSTPPGIWKTLAMLLQPFYHQVVWQAFTLTFLAEWGDRSQIATIAMAAAYNPTGVVLGGILGHALCTGMAVMGGRMLAARISEKMVAQYGGLLFLLFGIHSIFFESAAVATVAATVTSTSSSPLVGAAAAAAAGAEGLTGGEDVGN